MQTTEKTQPFEGGVLPIELELINRRRALASEVFQTSPAAGPGASPPNPRRGFEAAQATSALGLAFSGGGIRSATFNLGILQGLAECRLLPFVDYLSTVSGGGYIGAWLHGVIRNRHAGNPADARSTLLAGLNRKPGPPDDDPITFLRKYSNYLAPRPGLFSADTWTIGFIWLRNVLLNQLILVSAMAALIAAALLLLDLQQQPRDATVAPFGTATRLNMVVGFIAIASMGAAATIMARNLRPIARQSVTAETKPRTVEEKRAEGRSILAVAFIWVTSCALGAGLFDGASTTVRIWTIVGFALVMAFIQVAGGFVGCFVAGHVTKGRRPIALLHVVWMSTTAGLLVGALVIGVWSLNATWDPWQQIIFGPSLVGLSLVVAGMLLVGLMGADYPDAAREWTARIGSMLGITTVSWVALFGLAVCGPWVVSWFVGHFHTSGVAAAAMWAATSVGGVLAGRSEKTGGSSSPSVTTRALEILTSVAPTVFLVGYLVAIAAGVHLAVQWLDAPLRAAQISAGAAPPQYDVTVTTPEGAGVEVTVNRTEDGKLQRWLEPARSFASRYPSVLRISERGLALDRDFDRWTRLNWLVILFAALAVVTGIVSSRININEFSLHHFYKNRLVRCYLGASKSAERNPNALTGFDPLDDFPLSSLTPDHQNPKNPKPPPPYLGPYPIVNATLNLNTGSELAQQERKAASFVFTPKFCGFDPPSSREGIRSEPSEASGFEPHGYRPTNRYAYSGGPNTGTTVAISGAAANPNWGYHTSGPMAFLLTVFNARLGWWLGNPRWLGPSQRPGPIFALKYLFAELLGQTTGRSKFVNLSDGGHFDNLGLYELVRRRCRFIIVSDAEEDAGLTFGSLGGAIRKCRADFGVEIDINPDPIRLGDNSFSSAHCVVGTVTYPEQETAFAAGITGEIESVGDRQANARGWLLYLKSSLSGDEPADVIEYRSRCSEFPHQSTADQFFSESQFESYRRLGLHVLRSAFDGVTVDRAADSQQGALMQQYPLVQVFQDLTRKWYAPLPVTADAASRLADSYVALVRRLSESEVLRPLYAELEDSVKVSDTKKPHQLSPELRAAGQELIQLMENVYTEFKFEYDFNQANPRNAGWMRVFRRWVQSGLLYEGIWPDIQADYHPLFGKFVKDLHDKKGFDMPRRP